MEIRGSKPLGGTNYSFLRPRSVELMKGCTSAVVIQKDKDGFSLPALSSKGAVPKGAYEEVLENMRDAIRLVLEDMKASGENIPSTDVMSLTTLEVAV